MSDVLESTENIRPTTQRNPPEKKSDDGKNH